MRCVQNYLKYLRWNILQKQSPRGVLRKRCFENMQQIYRRAPMPMCDFNKVVKQLPHGCFPVNFLYIFRTPFPRNTCFLTQHFIFQLSKAKYKQTAQVCNSSFRACFLSSVLLTTFKHLKSKTLRLFQVDFKNHVKSNVCYKDFYCYQHLFSKTGCLTCSGEIEKSQMAKAIFKSFSFIQLRLERLPFFRKHLCYFLCSVLYYFFWQ